MSKILKFAIESLITPTLNSLGTQLGEAIGKRLGSHFDPKPDAEKAKEGEKVDVDPS